MLLCFWGMSILCHSFSNIFWTLQMSECCQALQGQVWVIPIYLGSAFQRGKAVITLEGPKPTKSQKGAMITLGSCSTLELCQVSALTRYLDLRKWGEVLLFRHYDSKPLTKISLLDSNFTSSEEIRVSGSKIWHTFFSNWGQLMAAALGYSLSQIQCLDR